MRLTRRSFLLCAVSLPVVAGLPAGEAEAVLAPEIDLYDLIANIEPTDTPLLSLARRTGTPEWVVDELRPYADAP